MISVFTSVVLASGSPRRHELLRVLLADFAITPAVIDERITNDPLADARRLAREKAAAVFHENPEEVVIGADTIVHDGEFTYGKPGNAENALAMLGSLRGKTHLVVTGIAVVYPGGDCSEVSDSHVTLADLSDETIGAYVADGRPFDRAGAYGIQDDDVPTVAALDGCYCSVMGLPLWGISRLLATAGVETHEPQHVLARCAVCPER
ncbi:MAG TPA: septum formation protein Maf [Dehalococcoidia bacterium]|nr:septum formation protein Maf [Dehalococcoidia bacterium]